MCVKTLLTNDVTIEYGHPLTTWVVEYVALSIGKTNTPLRKEFPVAPLKKIATLVLCSTFGHMLSLHVYHQIQKHCTYPNYDVIPNTIEIGKRSPSLIWVNLQKLYKYPHCLGFK